MNDMTRWSGVTTTSRRTAFSGLRNVAVLSLTVCLSVILIAGLSRFSWQDEQVHTVICPCCGLTGHINSTNASNATTTFVKTTSRPTTGRHPVAMCPNDVRAQIVNVSIAIATAKDPSALSNATVRTLSQNYVHDEVSFNFTINEEAVCGSQPVFLLMYVHSGVDRQDRRDFIRTSWGQAAVQAAYNMKIVFVVGQKPSHQSNLLRESQMHHDIIQANFTDVYANLTLKEAASLRWSARYCPQAEFVIKADDDLIIQPWLLIKLLLDTFDMSASIKNNASIICHPLASGTKPYRVTNHKWHVSRAAFPPDVFPAYCVGPMRIYTRGTVALLVEASGSWLENTMPIEDVYYTGIVPDRVGVKRVHVPRILKESSRYGTMTEDDAWREYIASHNMKLKQQKEMWAEAVKGLVREHPCYEGFLTYA